MCYSLSLRKTEQQISDRFNADMDVPLIYEPFYFQSGFAHQNLFMVTQDKVQVISPTTWGFIPDFAHGDIAGFFKRYNTLNAKSETVFDSKMYRRSILDKRCLIIADGFFEPHDFQAKKYPYFCHYHDDALFAFAGIYNELDDGAYSCSILTTKANPFFENIHNVKKRMPLVLDESFETEWLRNDLNDKHIKELMRVGFSSKAFEAYTVSKNIYKKNHDANNSDTLKRVDYPELNFTQGNLFD